MVVEARGLCGYSCHTIRGRRSNFVYYQRNVWKIYYEKHKSQCDNILSLGVCFTVKEESINLYELSTQLIGTEIIIGKKCDSNIFLK